MVNYYVRKYGVDGVVMISIRVRTSEYDKHFALGIGVDTFRWQLISQVLKNAQAAYKRGASIFIEDTLASKLWQLQKELLNLQASSKINEAVIKQLIAHILKEDEVQSILRDTPQPKLKPTFLEFVEQYIKECEDGERLKQKSTRKVTAGTIKNYKGFLAQMLEYQKSRKRIIDWDDLNFEFYNDYKQYFIEKSYSPNTIARHIKPRTCT